MDLVAGWLYNYNHLTLTIKEIFSPGLIGISLCINAIVKQDRD